MPLTRYVVPQDAFWYDDIAEQDELVSWLTNVMRYWTVTAERQGGVTYYVGGGEYTTVYPTGVWVAPGIYPYALSEGDFKALTGPFPEWPSV